MNAPLILPASEWTGCYDGGWQGEIVAEAFAHPAKVSRALIRRIYAHAFDHGWLRAGDVVVDPFGGICGTALDAMWNGLHWTGCELEQKFVGLGGENIDLWNRRYGLKPGFGSARILQGDSRKLSDVVGGAACVLGSPPFADSLSNKPSTQILAGSGGRMGESCKSDDYYGVAEGQLGAMREGTAPALICSSPPYAAIATGAGGLNTKPGADGQQSGRNASSASQTADQRYGETAGQLAVMREGEAPACIISSPPFAAQQTGGGIATANGVNGNVRTGTNCGYQNQAETDGNLGSMPEGRFDAVIYIDSTGDRDRVPRCQHAKTAESALAGEVSDAVPALTSASANYSKGERNQTVTASASHAPSATSRCQTTTDQCTNDGAEEARLGEGMHGDHSANSPSKETAGSAANADPSNTSTCTTRKTPRTRGANGITRSATSKPCAQNATSRTTESNCTTQSAPSAIRPTARGAQELAAQSSAERKCQSEPGLNSTSSNQSHTCAPNAPRSSVDQAGDGNTAPRPVFEGRGQKKNLSGESKLEPDTFWASAQTIVQQCHQVLRPGGHAIWIVKDFVRRGKRVPFSDQWQALCEQEGFRLVCRHRAMLVARHGEQDDIFGATQQLTTARKSFFRRLAEAKGSPAIDWEDVICVEKAT